MRRAALLATLVLLPGLAFGQAQPVPADQPIPAGQPLVSPWARLQPVTAASGMVVSAGSARRAHRPRHPAAGRQRRRRGGGGRLRAGGDAAAGRQSRRRRLHAGPSRRAQDETVAIDYRETAPRRDHAEMSSSTTQGNADPKKSTRQRPGRRRSRHGRRARPGAAEIRLGQVHPRATWSRRRSRWRARACRSRTTSPIPCRWRSRASRAGRSTAGDLLQARRRALGRRRHAGAERPRRHAGARSRARDRAPSTRARSPTRSSPPCSAAGGIMTARRPPGLRGDPARAGARQLSRLRRRLDAAGLLGRRASDRDAQHPGRLSTARSARRLPPRRCI